MNFPCRRQDALHQSIEGSRQTAMLRDGFAVQAGDDPSRRIPVRAADLAEVLLDRITEGMVREHHCLWQSRPTYGGRVVALEPVLDVPSLVGVTVREHDGVPHALSRYRAVERRGVRGVALLLRWRPTFGRRPAQWQHRRTAAKRMQTGRPRRGRPTSRNNATDSRLAAGTGLVRPLHHAGRVGPWIGPATLVAPHQRCLRSHARPRMEPRTTMADGRAGGAHKQRKDA
mmetsp:Transcript_103430/g.299252  ORF Transcript_103430/g.299252 Transcript_103430/m.299252 type:complete len:229 (+) Transcript_103430:1852-2538(+)